MPQALVALRRHAATIDPAVATLVVLSLAVAVAAPSQAPAIAAATLESLVAIAPYLAVSVLVAAGASASGADGLIAAAFRGRTARMIVLAATLGALSPFCSCGVIPLIAALLAMGVPLPPVMAFWLASPLMDPGMFALTAGTLGTGFAVAKTVAAIGLGLAGGFGVWAVMRLGGFDDPLREGVGNGGCGGNRMREPAPVVWRFWSETQRSERFTRVAGRTTLFLGKWLALAFLLQSLMIAYVPAEAVASLLGNDGLATIALATLVGVPAYLNGYAALPLVSGLIGQGMAPGVGMAFLVAGGVTSIPAAIAVFALARPPVFVAYAAFALTGAFASGVVYSLAG